jgi:hypothetical protein
MMDLDLSKRSSSSITDSRINRINFQTALADSDWDVIRYTDRI